MWHEVIVELLLFCDWTTKKVNSFVNIKGKGLLKPKSLLVHKVFVVDENPNRWNLGVDKMNETCDQFDAKYRV